MIKIFRYASILSLSILSFLNVSISYAQSTNTDVDIILNDLSDGSEGVNYISYKCSASLVKDFSSSRYLSSIGISNQYDIDVISQRSCNNFHRIKSANSNTKENISISKEDAIKITLISMINETRNSSDFAVMLKRDLYKDINKVSKELKKKIGIIRLVESSAYDFLGALTSIEKLDDAILIGEGDITNNVMDDNESCVLLKDFKSYILSNSTGISSYPISAATITAKDGESFKDKFQNLKNRYPSLVGELEAVEEGKRYFTVKELKNSFGRVVGIIILDPKEKIKTKIGKHNISSMVKIHMSLEDAPSKKHVVSNWNDGICPISYNPLELRRNLISECYLCKYLYSVNNTFMITAELFFKFIKTGIVGFLIVIFSLWIALKFYENVESPEGFDPKSYVTSMFRKPIRIAFFFAIIFASPRFLANTFFYPIVMIGTSSMQLTIESLEKTEESFMSSEEREIVSKKRFCDPEDEFRDFLSDKQSESKELAEAENIKLFPKSKEILSRKSGLSESGGSSYQANLENNDISDVEVTDGEYYIGQMTCGIKSIKKMFATNRVLGELLVEDAVNKISINPVNIGILALYKLNPLASIGGEVANISAVDIFSAGATPLSEVILEACLGIILILLSSLIVLYIFFSFFELMVDIALKIMILPIGIIFWCFDSGKNMHIEILKEMKNVAIDFFKLALRMSFIFLIYKASITFILGLSVMDINKAFVYGSKSYILNSIDISHLSFMDLLFIIIINIYIITNIPDYVNSVIGGAREAYENSARTFVKNASDKITKATPTAYKIGKKYISNIRRRGS